MIDINHLVTPHTDSVCVQKLEVSRYTENYEDIFYNSQLIIS